MMTIRAVKSSWLPAKIAAYLVSISQLLCLAFLSGGSFLNEYHRSPTRLEDKEHSSFSRFSVILERK